MLSASFLSNWFYLLILRILGMNPGLKKWRKETQDAGMQVSDSLLYRGTPTPITCVCACGSDCSMAASSFNLHVQKMQRVGNHPEVCRSPLLFQQGRNTYTVCEVCFYFYSIPLY